MDGHGQQLLRGSGIINQFFQKSETIMSEKQLSEVNLNALVQGRTFTPSPEHWEDEVLYFLLADRFSDGQEDGYLNLAGAKVAGTTPKFASADNGDAISTSADAQNWRNAGADWVGG